MKTVSVEIGLECPASVSSANWIGGHTYPDTFAIEVSGKHVTASRTDGNEAWGMNLQFACTKKWFTTAEDVPLTGGGHQGTSDGPNDPKVILLSSEGVG